MQLCSFMPAALGERTTGGSEDGGNEAEDEEFDPGAVRRESDRDGGSYEKERESGHTAVRRRVRRREPPRDVTRADERKELQEDQDHRVPVGSDDPGDGKDEEHG